MALVADDVREEMTPQQLLQYEAMQAPDPLRASLFERRVAAQVSEHPLSSRRGWCNRLARCGPGSISG